MAWNHILYTADLAFSSGCVVEQVNEMLQPTHKKNNYTLPLFLGWFDDGENSNAMVEDKIPQCRSKQLG